ncbi:MAG: tripartite tricarboxylate transporter substrate binding protein [Comamonadaceae bacterium]|jgi:tripartite-type tricarboxylate transporter receptor subunit TctC|uniref:Bug family tripartite tricarboxylate transporter substrate binding protein n=1 Tax=Candidatus Skiveiella danica TaxID=3386177 RepID=UPI00390B8CB2|nr:tripartite tricarboxylate transporter substrate binding protein [Comamonadaceae bacterium]MBK8361458.1 tripartite tricarboxylate transporter substrate binding protein [Comamonadaceae bacterium]MBK9986251.1 tripartite tricarboxylate transporter substrate binding protein [Betaproteobacteria bacterium]
MQRRTFVTAAAATLAAPMLHAQTLPSGPVRIVVGFPPGGGTDALARVVGQKLATMWNLSVVIENKAGAAGVIAADYVSKQPGDGNTLLMAHINSHALAPAMGLKLNYNAEKDFVPISMVGVTPMLLICNPDQPAKTVKDLVALCKANPGKISFASAGGGSAQHFALEMFKLRAQIFALHVPYRGSAPALTDLIGGQVNYCFETMTSATPFVKSGKVVALAQTRLKRAKSYPNVPTMAESGFPGFEATVWYGLMGPGKMPPAMAQRMNEDVNKVLAMPDVQEKMEQYGAEDGGGSIEKFASFIKDEQQKWAQVAKAANVKVDA